MKVNTLDELEHILTLVQRHNIDVLELGDLKVVRGASVLPLAQGTGASEVNVSPPATSSEELEELMAWSEGGVS